MTTATMTGKSKSTVRANTIAAAASGAPWLWNIKAKDRLNRSLFLAYHNILTGDLLKNGRKPKHLRPIVAQHESILRQFSATSDINKIANLLSNLAAAGWFGMCIPRSSSYQKLYDLSVPSDRDHDSRIQALMRMYLILYFFLDSNSKARSDLANVSPIPLVTASQTAESSRQLEDGTDEDEWEDIIETTDDSESLLSLEEDHVKTHRTEKNGNVGGGLPNPGAQSNLIMVVGQTRDSTRKFVILSRFTLNLN